MIVVRDRAIRKIHRADPEAAAAAAVHSSAEVVRGRVVAAEEACYRYQREEEAYCRTGVVGQVSRRTGDSPGCSKGSTWLSGDAGGRIRGNGVEG